MMLRQVFIVSVLNFKSLRHRLWRSLVIVVGMACVSGVLLSMLSLTEGESAPYRTRIVVVRPQDPTQFNGTVVLEWLNVSSGFDTLLHEYRASKQTR